MSDPIQDIARQLCITTFGDGLLTKIRETIDLLQSDANNLMQYKEVAAELEAELAELKSQKPVTWRCRIAGSDHWAYFPNKSCRFCEPLYANPVAQAELAALKAKAAAPLAECWKMVKAMLAAAPAQPQSDSVQMDAKRYRWLRAQFWHDSDLFVVSGGKFQVRLGTLCPSAERLDEAIDKALRGVDQ